jgi:hypothetical protein
MGSTARFEKDISKCFSMILEARYLEHTQIVEVHRGALIIVYKNWGLLRRLRHTTWDDTFQFWNIASFHPAYRPPSRESAANGVARGRNSSAVQ